MQPLVIFIYGLIWQQHEFEDIFVSVQKYVVFVEIAFF